MVEWYQSNGVIYEVDVETSQTVHFAPESDTIPAQSVGGLIDRADYKIKSEVLIHQLAPNVNLDAMRQWIQPPFIGRINGLYLFFPVISRSSRWCGNRMVRFTALQTRFFSCRRMAGGKGVGEGECILDEVSCLDEDASRTLTVAPQRALKPDDE
jgi:hypothetical protein